MKKELKKLDDLKGSNPFIVPEGYMEGLTSQIMSQLPEKEFVGTKEISMMDRVRPWLYMAAVFVGLGLFFKIILGLGSVDDATFNGDLLVKSEKPAMETSVVDFESDEDDLDYLDYLETQYADYLLVEEFEANE